MPALATASPLFGRGAIASATTDGALVSAPAGRLYVLSLVLSCTGTATTVTLNTKPAGAGTAVLGPFNLPINGTVVLPFHPGGYCRTNAGEGLTATTTAGSTVTVELSYAMGSR